MNKQLQLGLSKILEPEVVETPMEPESADRASSTKSGLPLTDERKTWAFESSLAPERQLELAKIVEDYNLDFDTVRFPAAQEAGSPYMAELEEESGIFEVAAFVFWRRYDDGCIRTAVFVLSKNDFMMDWSPGDETEEEFFKQKQAARQQEIKEKTWWMGMQILRHQFEPLGTFCISLDDNDDEDDEEPDGPTVWRFARPPVTPEKQDFLEVVADAFRFRGFAKRRFCERLLRRYRLLERR